MNNIKIGNLIFRLRKESCLTQLQLAEKLNISDKTVSKWERGLGSPDISLIADLSKIFSVDLENLLSGELDSNGVLGGNIKNMSFYVCPDCGNLITAMAEAGISCCGKRLKPIQAKKADESEKLNVEVIENEYFISSNHEMKREHYISYIVLLTSDSIIMKKQYPEWDLQTRLPVFAHGRLLWYCTNHGLFYQNI